MTITNTLGNTLAMLLAPFFSTPDDDALTGPEQVKAAMTERDSVFNRTFEATFEDILVKDFGGMFQSDLKVVIPVSSTDYEDPGSLIFDMPANMQDVESLFVKLLTHLDVDLHELEQLKGMNVPMEIVGGNPMVLWDAVEPEESGEDEEGDDNPWAIGTEDSPASEEDVPV